MLEDQVAYLLQKYLGNYVRGLNKEALKISVWQGDVELKNMQLKPEALNALKLPVKVKAGFLGSVKLKVPWSRLGQDPVLVYLDRIFLLAEPATQVEGCSEDAMQEAKKIRIQEMEMKLLEKSQQLKSEMNKSWLGSVISTIIGNLKLSISNVHIRYEDSESNPGHPFAAGAVLERLSAFTVDDFGKETFVTGGALDHIQKSVELHGLAVYLDSDVLLWDVDKPWQDLLPSEWYQVFKFGTKDGKPADYPLQKHCYILQPVTGHANYSKLRLNEVANRDLPLKKAEVYLDDVTLCLSQDGYRDILKVADNFAAFNQRLNYAHYRPRVPVKADPKLWWKYAYRVVSSKMKKESGKMSWEQVLKYARLRKRYISLYASLLKADPSQTVVDDNEEIERLDQELDMELILQWRMLAHKFVERSVESDLNSRKQRTSRSWWPFGGTTQSPSEENEAFHFTDEDWDRLNQIIGYKEEVDGPSAISNKADALDTSLVIHMKHNASKLVGVTQEPIAELSCENISCTIKLYPETKVFNMKLGSYQLSSPNGLLAESASSCDSLVAVFSYKPFHNNLDWSMVARASPCYMTYLKDTVEQIIKFFKTNTAVSQVIAMETAAAVQTTIDEVKRTAQQQVSRALKDHARFSLDLDIAAPKITIPTDFHLDNSHTTKLLLDLGNLVIHTQDDDQRDSIEEDMYLEFDLVLSDVSAFLYDGDYCWGRNAAVDSSSINFLPIVDKCGVILKLQQIRVDNPYYPSTRLSVRLPTLGFHFSPARYHRLMEVVKIFQDKDSDSSEFVRPWDHTDFEGWLSVLVWKGVGNREAVWQRRYMCLVGPFLYALESPDSKGYKQCIGIHPSALEYITYGKPNPFVFKKAEILLSQLQPSQNHGIRNDEDNAANSFKTIYMIGDNPSVDIKGVQNAGHPWFSILTRTGVFKDKGNHDKFPADLVVDTVEEAVEFILTKESSQKCT